MNHLNQLSIDIRSIVANYLCSGNQDKYDTVICHLKCINDIILYMNNKRLDEYKIDTSKNFYKPSFIIKELKGFMFANIFIYDYYREKECKYLYFKLDNFRLSQTLKHYLTIID